MGNFSGNYNKRTGSWANEANWQRAAEKIKSKTWFPVLFNTITLIRRAGGMALVSGVGRKTRKHLKIRNKKRKSQKEPERGKKKKRKGKEVLRNTVNVCTRSILKLEATVNYLKVKKASLTENVKFSSAACPWLTIGRRYSFRAPGWMFFFPLSLGPVAVQVTYLLISEDKLPRIYRETQRDKQTLNSLRPPPRKSVGKGCSVLLLKTFFSLRFKKRK